MQVFKIFVEVPQDVDSAIFKIFVEDFLKYRRKAIPTLVNQLTGITRIYTGIDTGTNTENDTGNDTEIRAHEQAATIEIKR